MQLKISSLWLTWNVLESWRTWFHLPVENDMASSYFLGTSPFICICVYFSICLHQQFGYIFSCQLLISRESIKVCLPKTFQFMLLIILLFHSLLFLFRSDLYAHILWHSTLQWLTSGQRALTSLALGLIIWPRLASETWAAMKQTRISRAQVNTSPAKSSHAYWRPAKPDSIH